MKKTLYLKHHLGQSDNADYLVHYGVLGMRWGVRRYQNEDGSLTTAGRRRYSKNSKHWDELNETQINDLTSYLNARKNALVVQGVSKTQATNQVAKDMQIKGQAETKPLLERSAKKFDNIKTIANGITAVTSAIIAVATISSTIANKKTGKDSSDKKVKNISADSSKSNETKNKKVTNSTSSSSINKWARLDTSKI